MKKNIAAALFLSLLIVHPLYSADADVDVIMTIQIVKVDLIAGSLDLPVFVKENKVIDRSVLRNTSNGPEDFAVKVSGTDGAGWSLVSTPPQSGQYRLHALWHQWNIKPAKGEFQNNDILTGLDQTSTHTIFFNDSETHETQSVKGINVPANEERNLFIWVEGPSSGSGLSTTHITVTAVLPQ